MLKKISIGILILLGMFFLSKNSYGQVSAEVYFKSPHVMIVAGEPVIVPHYHTNPWYWHRHHTRYYSYGWWNYYPGKYRFNHWKHVKNRRWRRHRK